MDYSDEHSRLTRRRNDTTRGPSFVSEDDEAMPPGLDGIDEQRIVEAILRLEELAQELGCDAVLQVYLHLLRTRKG